MRADVPLVTPGPVTRMLAKAEVVAEVARWLDCFGQDRFGAATRRYLWHVFSHERHPSVSGEEARAQYEQHEAVEYVVISNERDEGFITPARPTACSFRDALVFPQNLAWTMAFTHEDGWLGPYFARSADYEALNAQNLQGMRKAAERERARRKGWC